MCLWCWVWWCWTSSVLRQTIFIAIKYTPELGVYIHYSRKKERKCSRSLSHEWKCAHVTTSVIDKWDWQVQRLTHIHWLTDSIRALETAARDNSPSSWWWWWKRLVTGRKRKNDSCLVVQTKQTRKSGCQQQLELKTKRSVIRTAADGCQWRATEDHLEHLLKQLISRRLANRLSGHCDFHFTPQSRLFS